MKPTTMTMPLMSMLLDYPSDGWCLARLVALDQAGVDMLMVCEDMEMCEDVEVYEDVEVCEGTKM